jgi:NitT/TauT family transport system substrate-binding protein
MNRRSAVLGLAAASSVAAFPSRPARAADLAKVRVLALAVDPCSALYYGKELGMFEAAGLDVDIQLPADFGAVISALVSGSAEVAYGLTLQIEQAFQKGLPVTMIAPASINDARHPTNFLIVAKDSPIKTARDLNGKTLGSGTLRSIGTYSTEAWMNAHGGDASTVKWAEIPTSLCAAAVIKGRLDAAFVIEPYATAARAETRLLGRPYEIISPYFLGAAFVSTTAWAAAHPDLVRKFVAGLHEAAMWANRNPAKSAPLLAAFSKVDLSTVQAMQRAIFPDRLTPETVQPSIDFGAKYKLLEAAFPAKDIIYRA